MPAGWDQLSATCDDGSPVVEHRAVRRRERDLHLHEPAARQHRGRRGLDARTTRRTSPSPRAAASAHELLARRRLRRHAVQHPHVQPTSCRAAATRSRRPSRRLGPERRHLRRRQPALEHLRRARRDRHLHVRQPQARHADRGRGRRAQRRPGLRLHGGRRPVAQRASRSTTTRTARCPTRARSATCCPARGYSLAQSAPTGWQQASATCNDGSPVSNIAIGAGETVTCTFTHHKQGRITVVKDATPNDPQDFSFTAGGGLSPDQLPARRRLRRNALEHAARSTTWRRSPGTRCPRPCRAAGTRPGATCDDGSPVSNIDVGIGER